MWRPTFIRSSIVRQICFAATSLAFILIALRASFAPDQMAADLGYTLSAPNGYSELYAIYVGVWLATAVLGIVAFLRVQDPMYGDLLAIFMLAQPLGRLLASLKWGMPQGTLLFMLFVEIIGGVLLLLIRPSFQLKDASVRGGEMLISETNKWQQLEDEHISSSLVIPAKAGIHDLGDRFPPSRE
jgi:Domain of unknown function (DUF4345)